MVDTYMADRIRKSSKNNKTPLSSLYSQCTNKNKNASGINIASAVQEQLSRLQKKVLLVDSGYN